MLVTVLFIFCGIVFVFTETSTVVSMAVSPIFKCVRGFLDRKFPQKVIDLDGDGGADFKVPRGPLIYYTKNLIAPVLVIVGGQNVWAAVFAHVEGGSYMRWWYHTMTTFTTVGYGDVSISTDAGKIVAIFHILFSVSLLGALITDVFELMKDRATTLNRAAMLEKRCDPELSKKYRPAPPPEVKPSSPLRLESFRRSVTG
jgi:hypothetical protein